MRVYDTCKDGKEYPEGGCQERARLVEAPLRPPGKSSRSIAAEDQYAAAAPHRYRGAARRRRTSAGPARIQVVPRTFVRPELSKLRAFFAKREKEKTGRKAMKFQIIQNDFTSRALRKEVGQVGFRRQPLFLQYLLRIFGLLCLGVSAFCLVTVGMSIANPGISPWKYTLLTFLYAIPFLFLGLHYMNLVPAAHGNFLLRNTFARRTEFRSDSFAEYIGDRKSEYQYRELGEVWEGSEALYLFVKPRKFLILQKKDFTQGELKSFRTFVQKKTGRPIRELRMGKKTAN